MDVLTKKNYKNYSKLSRYNPFPYYYHILDDKYVYGKTAYLKDTTIYSSYKVQKNDTYDSIALEFYNNPTLYWIICSFNHIVDPYTNPKEGTMLKIPSISNIEFDIK